MSGANSAPASLAKRCSSSPLRRFLRARCNAPAGHVHWPASANVAEVNSDLVEWDYGRFEGKTTADIQQDRPDWELFRDGCPGGESPLDVAQRADRFISRVFAADGDVLAFSSGHIIRMIAARWLGLPPGDWTILLLPTSKRRRA